MAEPLDHQSAPPAPHQPPRRALAIIFLIVFMDLLGFGVIIPQLPFYATAYDASALQVTVLFSIYSACQFLAAPILGALSDRYGRRPVLVGSQFGSVVGYVLLGAVPLFDWPSNALALGLIYLSRVIDGASGGNISTAQAYISDVTTPANRAKGMGLIGAAFGIGFSAGPALGALVGGEGRQHWPAFAAALFAGIATMLTYLLLPESRHRDASGARAALRTTHDRDIDATVRDDTDDAVVGTTATHPAARPSSAPPRRGFFHRGGFAAVRGNPALLQLLLISGVSMTAFVMMESTIALFLSRDDTFGLTSRQVGWFFAFAGVIIAIVQGGLIGRLTRVFGEWPLAVLGPALVAAGMGLFVQSAWTPLIWLLALAGACNSTGRSLQQPTLSSLVSQSSNPREQGAVFGLYHGLSSLARVIGPVIAGLIYELHPTGPFALACAIVLTVSAWTLVLRISAVRASAAAPLAP